MKEFTASLASSAALERVAFLCRVKIVDFSGLYAAKDATDQFNALQTALRFVSRGSDGDP